MSPRKDRRSDAGLDDLFDIDDEPLFAEEEEEAPSRPRVGWWIRNALLVGAATAATVGVLRLLGAKLPIMLVLAGFVALRWLMVVLDDIAPPPPPRPQRLGPAADPDPNSTDGLRQAVRRWETRLDWGQEGGSGAWRNLLAVLAELTDERLRLRHGLTRASDPQRARELLGEPLWRLLAEPDRRPPKGRDLANHLDTLEKL